MRILMEADVQPNGEEFSETELGEIEIAESGNQIISFNPVKENWNAMELKHVELVKLN